MRLLCPNHSNSPLELGKISGAARKNAGEQKWTKIHGRTVRSGSVGLSRVSLMARPTVRYVAIAADRISRRGETIAANVRRGTEQGGATQRATPIGSVLAALIPSVSTSVRLKQTEISVRPVHRPTTLPVSRWLLAPPIDRLHCFRCVARINRFLISRRALLPRSWTKSIDILFLTDEKFIQ